jgi:hypothetical protein
MDLDVRRRKGTNQGCHWRLSMPSPFPTRLLTTRARTGVAAVITASILALAIRGGLHPDRHQSPWLVPPSPLFPGWATIAINAFFYTWACWIGFWLIRATTGRERVFMTGFFTDIFVWPIRMWRPSWAVEVKHVVLIALTVALLAAVALLLDPPEAVDVAENSNATHTNST